eukprot:COSAG02_NODE_22154_length_761_cov_36.950151_1_plen_88_part_10
MLPLCSHYSPYKSTYKSESAYKSTYKIMIHSICELGKVHARGVHGAAICCTRRPAGPYAYVIRIGNPISKIELSIVYLFEPERTRFRR